MVKTKLYPRCLPGVWLKCSMRRVAGDMLHVTCYMLHVVSGCDETKCWLWRVTWPRDSAGIFTHDNILLRYNCYLAPACLVMTVMTVMNVMSRVTPNICFPCSPFHLAALTSQILLSWYPQLWKTDTKIQSSTCKTWSKDRQIITLKLSFQAGLLSLLCWHG